MVRALILASSLVAANAFAERVIVEFAPPPAVYAAARTANSRVTTLTRFRADVAALGRQSHIRHEYTVTFFGAAVDADGNAVASLRNLPYVRAIHIDREVQALAVRSTASDTLISDAGTRVNSLALPTRGEGARVAIIDTGIDYTHPALGGAFGPGHKVAGGYDFVNDDADPFDDNGHGTHVAGIIAADSPVLIGVAPHATLYAFKVLDNNGSGSESDVMAGIEAAADPNGDGDPSDHVDVANLSLGGLGSSDDPQSRAVDAAVAAGVVMCVAAGNSGGFAIISTPGTARTAITVGAINDSGAIASFSSRGPTPGDLNFKPDVVAPGVNIISSFPGGGTLSLSGTSMATPHVAGVCALLVSLHRDWKPVDVKNALTATATSINALPNATGAGRVDAQRAAAASIIAADSGISFGLDAGASGSFDITRSIVLTNHGTASAALTATPDATPSGVSVTISPSSASLAPGQSQQFSVHLTADNKKVTFSPAKLASGALTFKSADTTLSVPWMLTRSGRVTISYHHLGGIAFGYAPDSTAATLAYPYSDDNAEAYVTPGKTWEFLVDGTDFVHSRFLVTPSHAVNGDDTIALGESDAPYLIDLAATDENGTRLSALPKVPGRRRHNIILEFDWQGKPKGTFTYIIGDIDSFFVSAMPQMRLTVFQTYMDVDNARFFLIQHDPLQGVSASTALTKDVSALARSRWEWSPHGAGEKTLSICGWILQRADVTVNPFISTCMRRDLSEPVTIDSFISPEDPSNTVLRALSLASETTDISYIRAQSGSTFVSTDANPGPQSFRIDSGGETKVGVGPVYPLSFLDGPAGFVGPVGDTHNASELLWTIFDASGSPVANGLLPDAPLPPDSVCAQCRIEGSMDLTAAGHASRGKIEMRFANGADVTPPSITSLRLLDASGAIADRVKAGTAATLRFSAADYFGNSARPPKTETTAVAYRIEGTTDWRPLSTVVETSESGVNKTLGRRPAGDVYRIDLSDATAIDNALVDLRIDLEDPAGNHMTWTQSPAFMVGDVPLPTRHRSVR